MLLPSSEPQSPRALVCDLGAMSFQKLDSAKRHSLSTMNTRPASLSLVLKPNDCRWLRMVANLRGILGRSKSRK